MVFAMVWAHGVGCTGTLALGDPPKGGEEDARIVLSAWDFAGQPEYAAGYVRHTVAFEPAATATSQLDSRAA